MQGNCLSLGAVSQISMAGLSIPGKLRQCSSLGWWSWNKGRSRVEQSRKGQCRYGEVAGEQSRRGWGLGNKGLLLHQAKLQQAQPVPGPLHEAESRILPQVQDLTPGTAELFPAGFEATLLFHRPSLPSSGFRGIV